MVERYRSRLSQISIWQRGTEVDKILNIYIYLCMSLVLDSIQYNNYVDIFKMVYINKLNNRSNHIEFNKKNVIKNF